MVAERVFALVDLVEFAMRVEECVWYFWHKCKLDFDCFCVFWIFTTVKYCFLVDFFKKVVIFSFSIQAILISSCLHKRITASSLLFPYLISSIPSAHLKHRFSQFCCKSRIWFTVIVISSTWTISKQSWVTI